MAEGAGEEEDDGGLSLSLSLASFRVAALFNAGGRVDETFFGLEVQC